MAFRKAFVIALDGFIEAEGCHPVELGQICVEHHFLATDEIDPAFYQMHRNGHALCARKFLCHETVDS